MRVGIPQSIVNYFFFQKKQQELIDSHMFIQNNSFAYHLQK